MQVEVPDPIIEIHQRYTYDTNDEIMFRMVLEVGGVEIMVRDFHSDYFKARDNAKALDPENQIAPASDDPAYAEDETQARDKIAKEFGEKIRTLFYSLDEREVAYRGLRNAVAGLTDEVSDYRIAGPLQEILEQYP